MRRRVFLASLTAPLAGCSVGYQGTDSNEATADQLSFAELGYPASICSEEVQPEAIPPIVDPVFGTDWMGLDVDEKYRPLDEDAVVIGVRDGDRARAYPVSVLWYHEAVNDTFGGPLLVTYCSICRSGLVARRFADGEPATFSASGLLWVPPQEYAAAAELDNTTFGATTSDTDASVRVSGNVVLYDDRTRSYWSQLVGRAICGPLEGERFDIVPSTVARWGEWRDTHPETEVLLPPPESELR